MFLGVELITNIIAEYLKHNKRLVVPKLGAFIVKQPSGAILFSELMRTDDNILRSLLMAYGIKELEANGMMDRLAFEVRHAITVGERYTLKEFGEFMGGANGTIAFKQHSEPQVIGGNIKPPVETLNVEKRRLHRAQRNMERIYGEEYKSAMDVASEPQPKPFVERSRITRARAEQEESLTLGKPEAYLRGLKYEKRDNSKRGEEHGHGSVRRGSMGGRVLIFALLIAILGLGGWYAWQRWGAAEVESNATESEMEVVVIDSLLTESADSTAIVDAPQQEVVIEDINRVKM